MSNSRIYSGVERAAIAFMLATCVTQPMLAGTQGSYMNSEGRGRAFDTVKYGTVSSTASSPYMLFPCARVNPNEAPFFSCIYSTVLAPGIPEKAYCQSKGAPNYFWTIQAYVSGGATADNPELENLVEVVPADCAEVEVTTSAQFTDEYSGQITVNAFASLGVAMRLRGIEYPPGTDPETLEDLKQNGLLRFDLTFLGPFDLNSENCTALNIPFTTQHGHKNLYFVVDTAAKSTPFQVTCPRDVTFGCTETPVYPPVEVRGGCGELSVVYDPPVEQLGYGETPVTVTVTDEAGNTAYCGFTATRNVLGFEGFYSPINGLGGSCGAPWVTVKAGSVVPVKFKTLCGGLVETGGAAPAFSVLSCATGEVIGAGKVQLVANEWHGNWDTSGLTKGDYQLIVTLQDGSEKTVVIRLK